MRDFDFKPEALVLVRQTQIEKSLNRKMKPRYDGPFIVVSRNKGGAYILCELDGTVFDRPVAAFRLLPYFARQQLKVPPQFYDITPERLREMKNSKSQGDDDETEADENDETPAEEEE